MATERAVPVGGLTNAKLGLATATADDVLSGKTFYAGNRDIKTGSYQPKTGTVTPTGTVNNKTTVNVGFQPNIVLCWSATASRSTYWLELRYINGTKTYTLTNGSSYLGQLDGNRYFDISITSNGFELNCTEAFNSTFNYLACK